MIERLLIALLLVAVIAFAIRLVRFWLQRRDRRIVQRFREVTSASGGEGSRSGVPRIVYFTTKTCEACRVLQEPALERLAADFGPIVIQTHDAVEEPDLASEYGVLSTPTTAVYDRNSELVAINRSFTDVKRLLDQIDSSFTRDGAVATEAAG